MIENSRIYNFFSFVDYVIVTSMLLISMLIGFYHGFRNRKINNDELEYLMAGRRMSVVPVGLSIVASSFSALGLIGMCTEMYLYGSNYAYCVISYIIVAFLFTKYLLPIFHGLTITSIYHYLEKRFDRRVRLFGSLAFVIQSVLYMPILLYMPSLCFNQLTGIDVKAVGAILSLIVIFYTVFGGFRATVWTDVFQTIAMLGSMIIVIVKGYLNHAKENGAYAIFKHSYDTDRYKFPSLNPDPTVRHGFWDTFIGGICYLTYFFCNQIVLQRCLSLPTLKKAKRATWIFAILSTSIFVMALFGGMLLAFVFRECDPKGAGVIRENDQLFPLLVVLISEHLPGISGIFIGGMFCASLSSISTFLNSLAAVILEDFVKAFSRKELPKHMKNLIMKFVVIGFGLCIIPLVVMAEKTNTIGQFAISIESISGGSVLGLFLVGIFFPSIDGKCALIGGISGILVVGWISYCANTAIVAGDLTFITKHLPLSGCPEAFNVTIDIKSVEKVEKSQIWYPYKISFLYYIPVGLLTTLLISFFVRLCFGGNPPDSVDPALIWRPNSGKISTLSTEPNHAVESGKLMEKSIESEDNKVWEIAWKIAAGVSMQQAVLCASPKKKKPNVLCEHSMRETMLGLQNNGTR
ncbi:hypothetical protein DMENIID0001_054540 [Sergentomyia squamirostris]